MVRSLIYLGCVGVVAAWIGFRLRNSSRPRSWIVAWAVSALSAIAVALIPIEAWRGLAAVASEPRITGELLLGAGIVYFPVTGAATLVARRASRRAPMQFTPRVALQAMLASIVAVACTIVIVAFVEAFSEYFLGT